MSNHSYSEQAISACLEQLSDILTSGRLPGSRLTNDGPAQISQHLYVGSGSDAVNRPLLNRLRITHVLNCTSAEIIGDYSDVGFRVTNERARLSSFPVAENSSPFERREWSLRRPETGGDRISRTATIARGASRYSLYVDQVPNSASAKRPSRPYSSYCFNDVTRYKEYSFTPLPPPLFTSIDDGYGYSRRPITCSPYNLYVTNDVMANDVTTVIRGEDGSPYDPERSTVRAYLEMHADDSLVYPILRLHYDAARRFIDSARKSGGRALIHCQLGINRSVALAVAYLIDTEGVALTTAIRQLRVVRPNVLRNEGFVKQLALFAAERKLLDCR